MTRYLSEAEAWRIVAEDIARRGCLLSGLCYQVDVLFGSFSRYRNEALAEAMQRRIDEHMLLDGLDAGAQVAFEYGDGPVRVFAALFLALECEDEAKAAKRRAA